MENENENRDDIPCFFKRLRIVAKYKCGDLYLREFDSICCDGSVLIEGFNKGLTSLMTTKYIIEKLKLPLVGDIISRRFDTFAMVEEGLPSHGCRIYGNKRVVVFTSEYDFEAYDVQNDLIELVYEFARRHRNKMILSVDSIPGDLSKPSESKYSFELSPEGTCEDYDGEEEGEGELVDDITDDSEVVIDTFEDGGEKEGEHQQEEEGEGEVVEGMVEDEEEALLNALKELPSRRKILEDLAKKYEEKIFYVTNDEIIGQEMKKMGHTIPVRATSMIGISGGVLSRSSTTNHIPVICILGNLDPSGIGHTTAVSLISCIDMLLGDKVSIDLTDLTKENERIESTLKELISSISDGPVPTDRAPVPWESMYM